MKKLILFFLVFAAVRVAAQNTAISGTVLNEKHLPVRNAFIYDPQTKNAAYSDSTGAFNIAASPSSQLTVNARGYANTTVSPGNTSSLQVNLKADPNTANAVSKTDIDQAFKTADGYTVSSASNKLTGSFTTDTRDVVGSRFLFNKWVPGYVIKSDGSITQDPNILFNYDKMKGDLYFNQNGRISVTDKSTIKGFVLVNEQDQPLTFELVPAINSDLYSITLNSGPKYKIYKLIKTKYNPADFKTNGLSSTGNKYDEWADDNTYYVLNVKTSAIQPLELKKKAIKTMFASEGDKLNGYMTAHSSDKIDDDYLAGLGAALNQ